MLVRDLKKDVLAYLKRADVSPSTFGRIVVNDPRFVARLKAKDADLKASTIDKVRKYIDAENKKLDRREARKAA